MESPVQKWQEQQYSMQKGIISDKNFEKNSYLEIFVFPSPSTS